MNYTEELISFISRSPSCFHACENLAAMLRDNGYTELCESEIEAIAPKGKYFVRRNGSSLAAFTVPESLPTSFMMAASHSDSPTYKIKDSAEMQGAGLYIRLNTERYGGMIPSTWLDRPLSVAGRLIVRDGETKLQTKLVNVDRDLLLIPNVAPHMGKINDLNPACDLVPLFGQIESKDSFDKIVADAAGVDKTDVVSSDLFLYVRTPGCVWGANNEFFSAPKLDDLMCAYASVKALCSASPCDCVMPVCCVFDNEEVGSQTKQGAASTFLYDILRRVVGALGGDEADYLRAVASGFMVSADNAHAVHPNHPEFADPVHHPKMNGGIVIKHNAAQKYTTDAISAAIFGSICAKAGVPTQQFFNRSDMGGGSTLGNISGTQVSVKTVDIGMAQLAMHSSYETAGVCDTEYLVKALTLAYSCRIVQDTQDSYSLEFCDSDSCK